MKILYLYDFEDWAIHNVGKLWFNGLPGVETCFLNFKRFSEVRLKQFDIIWYGFLGLINRPPPESRLDALFNRIQVLKKLLHVPHSVIAVHDPSELFPFTEKWLDSSIGWKEHWLLKNARGVVVASQEMQKILVQNGVKTHAIPTMSVLSPVKESDIATYQCRVYTVFNDYPRKNMPLLNTLQIFCVDSLGIKLDYKQGRTILSEKEYMRALDAHEIYICTSFQEGGPIPAMDAMMRGAVVLSTPVGQMPELIVNGENGYLCSNEAEFRHALQDLSGNLDRLHEMRLASRRAILTLRRKEDIQKKVMEFLGQIGNRR